MSRKFDQFDLEHFPDDKKFEALLHRKVIGKTNSQRTSMKKYYRDYYKEKKIIPQGLYYQDARSLSGRKSTLPKIIENCFIEMVRKSASDDVNSPDFITKNLRTVVNFHRRLEDKFGEININVLYNLVHRHALKKFLDKPDYKDEEVDEIIDCFDDIEVFDKVQIDGCVFNYVEIKDQNGNWRRPIVIEFLDTGSRYMFEMGIYFSESNETSVDAFFKFLKSTEFPQKKIQIRPDNSNGFLNLKRPIKEINLKYSLPDNFFFSADFAKKRNPKGKAHLESSHRRLHGFEDYIMDKLPKNKLIKRIPGTKINKKTGKREIITISRFDITIEQLRETKLIQCYMDEHNEKYRTFSVSGRQKKWAPKVKFESYISKVATFTFDESHIGNCLKYGYRKHNATVAPSGRIRFNKCDYQVIEGKFYGGTKKVSVKVSMYENMLYIFGVEKDGVYIGEAMLISDTEKPKRTKKAIESRLKKSKFEQLVIYLERKGMTIKNKELERLIKLYKQGLNIDVAVQIVSKHKKTYDNYLKNQEFKSLHVGSILSNLFFAHYEKYKKNEKIKNATK